MHFDLCFLGVSLIFSRHLLMFIRGTNINNYYAIAKNESKSLHTTTPNIINFQQKLIKALFLL